MIYDFEKILKLLEDDEELSISSTTKHLRIKLQKKDHVLAYEFTSQETLSAIYLDGVESFIKGMLYTLRYEKEGGLDERYIQLV